MAGRLQELEHGQLLQALAADLQVDLLGQAAAKALGRLGAQAQKHGHAGHLAQQPHRGLLGAEDLLHGRGDAVMRIIVHLIDRQPPVAVRVGAALEGPGQPVGEDAMSALVPLPARLVAPAAGQHDGAGQALADDLPGQVLGLDGRQPLVAPRVAGVEDQELDGRPARGQVGPQLGDR